MCNATVPLPCWFGAHSADSSITQTHSCSRRQTVEQPAAYLQCGKGNTQLKGWDERAFAIPKAERPEETPSDAANTRYTPTLTAAYYFGLAIGLRVAGGAR